MKISDDKINSLLYFLRWYQIQTRREPASQSQTTIGDESTRDSGTVSPTTEKSTTRRKAYGRITSKVPETTIFSMGNAGKTSKIPDINGLESQRRTPLIENQTTQKLITKSL